MRHKKHTTHLSYLAKCGSLLATLLLLAATYTSVLAQKHDLYGLWVKRAAFGAGGTASIVQAVTDDDGNVYVGGTFKGTLNFVDDICNPEMYTSTTNGSIFVIKYDKNGTYQWSITAKTVGNASSVGLNSLDYHNGKLLFGGRFSGGSIPWNVTIQSSTSLANSKTVTHSTTCGHGAGGNLFNFLQVVDCETGDLETSIDKFVTGTHNVSAKIVGNQILALHYGLNCNSLYVGANSVASFFDLATGDLVGNHISYPSQPRSPNTDASRIGSYRTLPNGDHVLVQNSHNYNISSGGSGAPWVYLLLYSSDFSTQKKQILLTGTNSGSATGTLPLAAFDENSNTYLMMNYGWSRFWNTNNPVPNSNYLTNFVGSGKNFETAAQCNKLVLAKLNANLDYTSNSWILQIGENSTANTDKITGADIKTVGNYTYVTGNFDAQNLDFNPLGGTPIKLSSVGGTDAFYAIYDNSNGHCVYATRMGGEKDDSNNTLFLSANAKHLVLGGSYTSKVFQTDPSDRLYPITSNGTTSQGFVTLYSVDSLSSPTPYSTAFGDGPISYGVATHYTYPCLRLGGVFDLSKMQMDAAPSIDANTAGNDDAVTLLLDADGYTNLSSANFTLLANGSLQAKISVFNNVTEAAKLIGWIDFNRNGVFDADEASAMINVPASSGASTQTLTWAAALGKLQNGVSYLRLRLSTDDLSAATPSGLLFNGDVEDHKLNFNILGVEKTAVSDNKNDNARASIGDTITYSVSVKNNAPVAMQLSGLFDPIPDSTVYVTGSATPAGTLGTVSINGESVNAITWPTVSIPAAGTANYSFKVALTAIPKGDSVINNIAYVVLNGDTIPSTGTNCYLAPIAVDSLRAVDDYAYVFKNKSVTIPVIANDIIDCSFSGDDITNGLNGTAVWNSSHDSVTYTPNTDFVGLDSFTYTIKCGSSEATATVHINVFDLPDNIIDPDCFDIPLGTNWSIREEMGIGDARTTTPFVVGDLNEDGNPDIAALNSNLSGLIVFWGPDFTNKTNITVQGSASSYSTIAIGRVKIAENSYKSLVFTLVGTGSTVTALRAYDPANPGTYLWTTACNIPGSIGLADFNNDGWAEVYVGNRIYDAATGNLLCDGLTNNKGTAQGVLTNISFPLAVDIIGDSRLELVAGNQIYDVKIDRSTMSGTIDVVKTVTPPTGCNADGFTVVADFDNDGKLEVLVRKKNAGGNGAIHLYLWTPHTDTPKILAATSENNMYYGIPFVGDIDGDGFVEIVTLSANGTIGNQSGTFKAHKYDKATGTFTNFWSIDHTDQSGATAMTLFDFDQNGSAEIVYRDEKTLRIIDGSTSTPVLVESFISYSETFHEYPIVADIFGDGHARILVTSDYKPARPFAGYAQIKIYGSEGAYPWAPARKVWNQYAYNALNVNEDLTIPQYPMSVATVFPGLDGTFGTADDLRPYNAFLKQQTLLNKNGVPVFTLPDLQWTSTPPAFSYHGTGDSLTVTVEVKNDGDAGIGSPVYFTVYKDAISPANVMGLGVYNDQILPDETVTFSFRVDSVLKKYHPINQLIIRLNDSISKYPYQQECVTGDSIRTKVFADILRAVPDTASTKINIPVTIDVLDNDVYGACASSGLLSKVDTVAGSGLRMGSLVINADSTFTYTPQSGKYGIDSVDYYIKCAADSSAARVYVAVLKSVADSYIACPAAVVNIAMAPIAGVQYYWYTNKIGGTPVSGGSNVANLNVTKDNSPQQTWWVEARYNGISFPRYRVDLNLSESCGGPAVDCVEDGTLLFREDFGGNNAADPAIKPSGISQISPAYTYTTANWLNGAEYSIRKKGITGNSAWAQITDHTNITDPSRGYFLQVNADFDKGQFYEHRIDSLCAGVELMFSAWISNLIIGACPYPGGICPDAVNQIFILEDDNGNVLTQYNTGDIPNHTSAEWKNYGFKFTVPDGITALTLRIVNNGAGSLGNDFGLDDIEIRFCAPPVTITQPQGSDTIVCPRTNFVFEGNYADSPSTFGQNLVYRWEYSSTGNVNDPLEWTVLGAEETSSNGIITATKTITNVSYNNEGYYRLVVGNAGSINSSNCRAASEPVHLQVRQTKLHYPDVRVQVCPTPARQLNLNQFIDTVDLVSVTWARVGVASPVINGDGHTINTAGMLPPMVYAYKYTAENNCLTQSGTVYLTPLTDETSNLPPDTVQVCYEVADALLLNQLLGVEAGGIWVYDNTVNPDNVAAGFVSESVLPSVSAGAVTFNGKAAWGVLGSAYDYTYKGVQCKKVVFKYRTPANSCLGATEKTMVIILTDTL